MLQDAVERNIATIGEAMNKALKLDPDLSISFARRIVGTRNRLIHGYDDIDNIEVWNIVVNNLPVLKSEIERISTVRIRQHHIINPDFSPNPDSV